MLSEAQERSLNRAPLIETGLGMDSTAPGCLGSRKVSLPAVRSERGAVHVEEAWQRIRDAPKMTFRRKVDREGIGWNRLSRASRREDFPELLEAPEAWIVVSYGVFAVDGEVFLRSDTATTVEFSRARHASGRVLDPREDLFHDHAEKVVTEMQERFERREGLEPLESRICRDSELRDVRYMLGLVEVLGERAGGLSLGEKGRIGERIGALRREVERYEERLIGTTDR